MRKSDKLRVGEARSKQSIGKYTFSAISSTSLNNSDRLSYSPFLFVYSSNRDTLPELLIPFIATRRTFRFVHSHSEDDARFSNNEVKTTGTSKKLENTSKVE